jgi:hypothetical protein
MGCCSSNSTEERVVFDAKVHSETSTNTQIALETINGKRKINEVTFTKNKTRSYKFTVKNNKLIKAVKSTGKFISIVFITVKLEDYFNQPAQVIKDLQNIEHLLKLFI